MAKKLKVLISAYACEPFKGSEPEVGWQWALQMARFHDVTVLTRANNRENIKQGLRELPPGQPKPAFVYHDLGPWLLFLKRCAKMPQIYYTLWQKSAWRVVAELHREQHFDLLHHLTFAGYRYTTAVWGHGVPCIWGPVGGMESIPMRLLPWRHPAALFFELTRNANNLLQSLPFHVIPRRAYDSAAVLVSTRETADAFGRLGIETTLMPTVGISRDIISAREITVPHRSLELLFVGQIIALKGVDFAIESLARSKTDARLTFVGSGKFLRAAKALVHRLGLESRVCFHRRVPRPEVLKLYARFDAFIFPSLHDSGGFAMLEAMASGLPVICLDCGGPALAVGADRGFKVAMGDRSQITADLAAAIEFYDTHRDKLREHGEAARRCVTENYEWGRKGEEMNAVYRDAVAARATAATIYTKVTVDKESRQLVWTRVHREFTRANTRVPPRLDLFSTRGIVAMLSLILIVAGVEFFVLRELDHRTKLLIEDTLPGLSYAGAANEARNQAFIRALLVIAEASSPADIQRYAHETEVFSAEATDYLRKYEASIFDEQDRRNFAAMMDARARYLALREQALRLVSGNQRAAAVALLSSSLLPAYDEYSKRGEGLMEFNIEQGKHRSRRINRIYAMTQIAVIIAGIAIFVSGFVLGFFKR